MAPPHPTIAGRPVRLAHGHLVGNLQVDTCYACEAENVRLSEAVAEIIRLGDASREYWDRELPKHHPRYPVIGPDETPPAPPPEDSQIQTLLESLPENQLYAVMVLAYLGRGDFSAGNLSHAYQEMKESFPSRPLAVAQLVGTNELAEYLTDAADEMQSRHIDLDCLKLASTVVVVS